MTTKKVIDWNEPIQWVRDDQSDSLAFEARLVASNALGDYPYIVAMTIKAYPPAYPHERVILVNEIGYSEMSRNSFVQNVPKKKKTGWIGVYRTSDWRKTSFTHHTTRHIYDTKEDCITAINPGKNVEIVDILSFEYDK